MLSLPVSTPPSLNTQPAQPKDQGDGSFVHLVQVFATIQGEGPMAGQPAVFIRLGGCPLQCPLCDTDYTTGVRQWAIRDIAQAVSNEAAHGSYLPLVVITGGEPFRQNIEPLLLALGGDGYRVQVETNGMYEAPLYEELDLTIVCSPKTRHVHPRMYPDYWKYVVEYGHVSKEDGLPTSVLGNNITPERPPNGFPRHKVYVQPVDAKDVATNQRNLETAVASCRQFGYTLGLQLHKFLGLD